MKKVFVHAYMARNLGDDLMVRILCKRYPKVRFHLYADQVYKDVFRDVVNLKVFSPDDRIARWWDVFWKKTKGADSGFFKMLVKFSYATVHIGGSVFVQHFDDYSAFLHMDRTLRRLSKRIYVVGANFGPYADENYYRQYHELLSRYNGVSFRDKYSYRMFRDLANVKYAPDVVFSYKSERKKPQVTQKKQVLFSVICMEDRTNNFGISSYAAAYKAFIIRTAQAFIDKGYRAVFISFCEMQGDSKAADEIAAALKAEDKDAVSICCYTGNIEECIDLFAESEIIVGTRFHSVILGWLKGKRVLPVVYDQKTLRVLEDNHCKVYVCLEELEQADIESLLPQIEALPQEDVERLQADAEKQFWALDRAL